MLPKTNLVGFRFTENLTIIFKLLTIKFLTCHIRYFDISTSTILISYNWRHFFFWLKYIIMHNCVEKLASIIICTFKSCQITNIHGIYLLITFVYYVVVIFFISVLYLLFIIYIAACKQMYTFFNTKRNYNAL